MRVRSWAFTSFQSGVPIWNGDRMKYLCYAPELTSEGKHHWQGYVYYHDKVSIKVSQKLLGDAVAHHEPTKGSPLENRTYIFGPYDKGDKHKPANEHAVELGEIPSQGKRVDLNILKDKLLKKETTIDNVLETQPETYHQYGRTLERLDDLRMAKEYRTEMTSAEWIWGPTGIGKSHRAFEGFTPQTHYNFPDDKGWWDNYKQQETVIINDFRGEIPYNELLQMMDKWPYEVRRRGRPPVPFTSRHVIITSSLPPKDIYKCRKVEDGLEQLYRRCKITNEGCKDIRDDFGNYID